MCKVQAPETRNGGSDKPLLHRAQVPLDHRFDEGPYLLPSVSSIVGKLMLLVRTIKSPLQHPPSHYDTDFTRSGTLAVQSTSSSGLQGLLGSSILTCLLYTFP